MSLPVTNILWLPVLEQQQQQQQFVLSTTYPSRGTAPSAIETTVINIYSTAMGSLVAKLTADTFFPTVTPRCA